MREILFRGKRIDKNEWVEGDLIHLPNGIAILANGYAYVIPETVGQYTGLKDRKGKMIFEGDICRGKTSIYEIVSNEDKYGWYVKVIKSECSLIEREMEFPLWHYDNCERNDYQLLEIIGNIHDNQELLEAES